MDKPEFMKAQKALMARFSLSWHNVRDTATRHIQAEESGGGGGGGGGDGGGGISALLAAPLGAPPAAPPSSSAAAAAAAQPEQAAPARASTTKPAAPRNTAGKANRNPYPEALASFATHDAAVAASRATLDAADRQAALQRDLAVLPPAWQDTREGMLRGGDGTDAAALRAMTEAEAQELLGRMSRWGNVEGMQRAEAAGADVRAAVYYVYGGSTGGICTAAYVAAYHNHGGGLRFLVGACGVDPNAVGCTGTGHTPLHEACVKGHPDAATVLLALGADPTVADKNGWTPCMYAAYHSGSVPCLRALAAGGPGGALGDAVNALRYCNYYAWNGKKTALDFAKWKNHDKAAACLRDELGGKRAADL